MTPLSDPQHRQPWKAEMNTAFEQGAVGSAKPEQLQQWSILFNSTIEAPEGSETVRIIRSLTLNHVQAALTIKKLESTIATLNSENDKVATRVLWLTFICAGGTVAQVIIALCR
jgi:hypothetical protein